LDARCQLLALAAMPEMTPATVAVLLAVAAVVAGLVVRGHWRLNTVFAVYCAVNLATGVMPYMAPERFYTQAFWMLSQPAFDIQKIGIVLEIIWRTVRHFPGAVTGMRVVTVTFAVLTAAAALALPLTTSSTSSYETAVELFHPRIMDGTIWFIAVALVVAWFHRLPVHQFHRSILVGLAIYMAFYSTLLRLSTEAISISFGLT